MRRKERRGVEGPALTQIPTGPPTRCQPVQADQGRTWTLVQGVSGDRRGAPLKQGLPSARLVCQILTSGALDNL